MDENRRRFFVCLHGVGPICKEIKDVYWGGQANGKRRPVWTSLEKYPGYKITPSELLLFFTIYRDVSHNVFTKCIHFMLKWQVSKWTMKRDAL